MDTMSAVRCFQAIGQAHRLEMFRQLAKAGDSFVIEYADSKKINSCRFSGFVRGKRLKFYPRPNGDCEVVYVEFVQEWVEKYKKNGVQQ